MSSFLSFFVVCEKYATFWTAFCAISTGLATLLGVIALISTVRGLRRSLKTSQYISLDGMYLTLLQLTLERPHLKSPETLTNVRWPEYDSYAYMLWNFLETIFDHCEKDEELRKTWYLAIKAEAELHGDWLKVMANRGKFKEPFLRFIDEKGYERP